MKIMQLLTALGALSTLADSAPTSPAKPSEPVVAWIASPADNATTHREERASFPFDTRPVSLRNRRFGETYISLINATPYRWKRIYNSSYQLENWDGHHWRDYINPGEAINHGTFVNDGWQFADSAGDVEYSLEGTKNPMSFMIQYHGRKHFKFDVHVKFQRHLQTESNGKNSRILLGTDGWPGGVCFLLSGQEGNFSSSTDANSDDHDEVPWMRNLFPSIGQLPLGEIVMPRSHHAALARHDVKIVHSGQWRNTATQKHDLYHQLVNEGVRVLDTRVILHKGEFRESHVHKVGLMWHGAVGLQLKHIIRTLNKFNNEFPGELIIWDFHKSTFSKDADEPIYGIHQQKLFDLLNNTLKHKAVLPPEGDITAMELQKLTGATRPGEAKSAVILRFHESWEKGKKVDFPGPEFGFVDSWRFPITSGWSNMSNATKMAEDQRQKLMQNRPQRRAKLFDLQWITTLKGMSIVTPPPRGIIGLGRDVMPLFHMLWNTFTDETYPNWITMDGLDRGEMRAYAIAMNRCFVAGECGDWVANSRKPRK